MTERIRPIIGFYPNTLQRGGGRVRVRELASTPAVVTVVVPEITTVPTITLICMGDCALGGKAGEVSSYVGDLSFTIDPNGLSLVSGADSIQLHTWTEEPNTDLTGRVFADACADTGGTVTATFTGSNNWISIFARNNDTTGDFDGACFTVSGTTITLEGYA